MGPAVRQHIRVSSDFLVPINNLFMFIHYFRLSCLVSSPWCQDGCLRRLPALQWSQCPGPPFAGAFSHPVREGAGGRPAGRVCIGSLSLTLSLII